MTKRKMVKFHSDEYNLLDNVLAAGDFSEYIKQLIEEDMKNKRKPNIYDLYIKKINSLPTKCHIKTK